MEPSHKRGVEQKFARELVNIMRRVYTELGLRRKQDGTIYAGRRGVTPGNRGTPTRTSNPRGD
jgi:hypothetical protein